MLIHRISEIYSLYAADRSVRVFDGMLCKRFRQWDHDFNFADFNISLLSWCLLDSGTPESGIGARILYQLIVWNTLAFKSSSFPIDTENGLYIWFFTGIISRYSRGIHTKKDLFQSSSTAPMGGPFSVSIRKLLGDCLEAAWFDCNNWNGLESEHVYFALWHQSKKAYKGLL